MSERANERENKSRSPIFPLNTLSFFPIQFPFFSSSILCCRSSLFNEPHMIDLCVPLICHGFVCVCMYFGTCHTVAIVCAYYENRLVLLINELIIPVHADCVCVVLRTYTHMYVACYGLCVFHFPTCTIPYVITIE